MSIVDIYSRHRVFATFLLLFSLSAAADDWQERLTTKLCQQWQTISSNQYECQISFPSLSSTFNLQACNDDWHFALLRPLQPGRNGIEITCDSPWWKQNLAIQLHAYTRIAVLAQPANIGQTLSAADINFVRHDIGTISKEFFTDPTQIIGQQVRRQLRAGTILNADMLDNPVLINRGEQVAIRINRPGVSIEIKGTALEQGKRGARIRVRNDQSLKTFTAVVVGSGQVLVE